MVEMVISIRTSLQLKTVLALLFVSIAESGRGAWDLRNSYLCYFFPLEYQLSGMLLSQPLARKEPATPIENLQVALDILKLTVAAVTRRKPHGRFPGLYTVRKGTRSGVQVLRPRKVHW